MKAFNISLLLLLTFTFVSCEDLFEDDITNEAVTTLTPKEGITVESNVVNFQWESLEGADKYRLQIIDNNQVIVEDTLTDKLKLVLPLEDGAYKWKIRGENFGYESKYSPLLNFQVTLSDNLTAQQVILTSPSTEFYTNSKSFNLTWQKLKPAESYSIQMVNVTNANTVILEEDGITATSYTLNTSILEQDAKYQWRIKAVNATSESDYSSRFFYLDTEVPNQPQNSLPTNNMVTAINQNINFSWTIAADSGTIQSPIESYIIEIATDEGFGTIIQTSTTTTTTFQRSFNTKGDYYWRVKAKDKAGNFSIASASYKLTLN